MLNNIFIFVALNINMLTQLHINYYILVIIIFIVISNLGAVKILLSLL